MMREKNIERNGELRKFLLKEKIFHYFDKKKENLSFFCLIFISSNILLSELILALPFSQRKIIIKHPLSLSCKSWAM
jgi:hypothetical protein